MSLLTDARVSSEAVPPQPAAAPPAQAAWLDGGGVRTIEITGALDLSTIARVREQLEDAMGARPERLVVDLSGCPFVDASALAMLLEAHRRMCLSGGVLTLSGASARVLRLLSLTGLRRVFDLSPA